MLKMSKKLVRRRSWGELVRVSPLGFGVLSRPKRYQGVNLWQLPHNSNILLYLGCTMVMISSVMLSPWAIGWFFRSTLSTARTQMSAMVSFLWVALPRTLIVLNKLLTQALLVLILMVLRTVIVSHLAYHYQLMYDCVAIAAVLWSQAPLMVQIKCRRYLSRSLTLLKSAVKAFSRSIVAPPILASVVVLFLCMLPTTKPQTFLMLTPS